MHERSRSRFSSHGVPPLLAALLCGAFQAAAGASQPPAANLPPVVELRPAAGVEIRLRQLQPGDAPGGPARLDGVVSEGRWKLRTSALVTPAAGDPLRMTRLDTGMQVQAPGWLQNLSFGDVLASGGGWSRPVRLGGLRFGRPLALRPGFDASAQALGVPGSAALPGAALGWAGAVAQPQFSRAPAAHLPGAFIPMSPMPAGPSHLPQVAGPVHLAPGAFDYEVEAGQLRTGWGTLDDRYGQGYAAAALRRGLGGRLTGELRTEWTDSRQATGLELSHHAEAGGSVAAVIARSQASGQAHGQAGLRWGLALARQALGFGWRASWDGFERSFMPLGAAAGEARARERLHASVQGALGRRLDLAFSYARQSAWDATPEQVTGVSLRWALPQGVQLALSLSGREGADSTRQHRLVLTLPFEATGPL